VVVAVIVTAAGLFLPLLLTKTKAKTAMANCANNMKQVSLAFINWAHDNGKSSAPWGVNMSEGGTRNHPSGLQQNAWFQYAWISNQLLLNPKVLACPSDKQAKHAETFTGSAQGGFVHPNYQDEACSYILGLEGGAGVGVSGPGEDARLLALELFQDFLLIADRNINTSSTTDVCSQSRTPAHRLVVGASRWLPQSDYGHGTIGNVAVWDGSVQKTSAKELNEIIARCDLNSVHCLLPRPPR